MKMVFYVNILYGTVNPPVTFNVLTLRKTKLA